MNVDIEKIEDQPNEQTTKRHKDFGFGEIKKTLGGIHSAITIINERDKQRRSKILSIFSGLTQFLLGGVNTMVLGYVINSGEFHAAFCTFAWHFFTAEAILSFNYASGWSSPLIRKYRRLTHICLQICSLISIITGAVFTLTGSGISTTVHGMTGFIAFLMTLLNSVLGPISLSDQEILKILHICFGIPTFLLSSTCLCSGFLLSSFKNYVGEAVSYVLISFVAVSTTYIIAMVIVNLRLKIEYDL